jgi:hypothetical protein
LSIDENNLDIGIKVYPNPFTHLLAIDAKEPIFKVEIYNLLGQNVKNIEFSHPIENSVNINLSELAKGNYLAKIYFKQNTKSIKIIKK